MKSIKTAVLLIAVCVFLNFSFVLKVYKDQNRLANVVFANIKTINEVLKLMKNTDDVNFSISKQIYEHLNEINKQITILNKAVFWGYQRVNELVSLKFNPSLVRTNVVIENKTQNTCGSGVYIKHKKKFYILTAGHLVKSLSDKLVIKEGNKEYRVEIIKKDCKADLMLLEADNYHSNVYAELSDKEPVVGDVVYIVGNPGGEKDIVSSGIIATEDSNVYIVDAVVFFGNSGGAVFYKNKIVGIVSFTESLTRIQNRAIYLKQFAGLVKLSVVKEFLNDIAN